MIVVLKPNTQEQAEKDFIGHLKSLGFDVHISHGVDHTILGLVGDTSQMKSESLTVHPVVDKGVRVQAPTSGPVVPFILKILSCGWEKIKVG